MSGDAVSGDARQDRDDLVAFFAKRFPDVEFSDHANGAYALDEAKARQWREIEDFPPYEPMIDEGERLFNTAFSNGSGYAACFEHEGIGIKQRYPRFDPDTRQVVTLELAVNHCRELNGESPLSYTGEAITAITAYMAFTSRGQKFDISVPEGAESAFNQGKQFYYSRRGQLNFACSNCHLDAAGLRLRAEILSATIGHATHWPAYRFKWQELGGIHRRFAECNEQVGAVALDHQSEAYRNLEYFMTVMNNGMTLNGPSTRK